MRLVLVGLLALPLLSGCEDKKKPVPPPPPSAEPKPAATSKEEQPAVVAYPPGMAPPEDAGPDAPPPEPKTGVCSFHESGYDGQDTKSDEKMIVKVKDDKIVAAEYVYRGSYAIDGKTDQLSVPFEQGKWVEIELPMTSGSKKFKVKIKNDVIELKGTAAQDANGDCVYVKPDKPDKPDKQEKKKKR